MDCQRNEGDYPSRDDGLPKCDGKVMEELVHQEDAWLDLELGEVLTKEKIYNCFTDKFRK